MTHEKYIQRCFDLARLGAGSVAPNPVVGAVLVHEDRIIGEGWHRQYGQAHAEVNALNSVKPADRHLIEKSTLYVSLEPCNIFGKTPPCTDLILRHKIPKVVVSCLDQTPEVSGRGVSLLRNAGVEVVTGILQEKGVALSRIRNTFVSKKRPYIVLKFARSKDGFMGQAGQQVWISNAFSNRISHRLRSELSAILVGTNTAVTDNPQLNTRYWFGKSPLRIVLDKDLRVPKSHFLYSDGGTTWAVTERTDHAGFESENLRFIPIKFNETLLPNLLARLFEEKISSLLVEGGADTLRHFIDGNWWDEAMIFTGKKILGHGIAAPKITGELTGEYPVGSDVLTIFRNPSVSR
jgi:diaminohydroxyphosphoribosylaminopyrimidine deaminase / 5-amino-6-(5-phosphoribosylamino)uracil reductase